MNRIEWCKLLAMVAALAVSGFWVDSALAPPGGGPSGGEPGGCQTKFILSCNIEGGVATVEKCADDIPCPPGSPHKMCDATCDPSPDFTIKCIQSGYDCDGNPIP